MKRKYAALAIALSASMAISPAVSVSAASCATGTPLEMVLENAEQDTTGPLESRGIFRRKLGKDLRWDKMKELRNQHIFCWGQALLLAEI